MRGTRSQRAGDKIAGFDLAADIDRLGNALAAVGQYPGPSDIAIPFHHCVGPAQLVRLLGIKRGVNSAENYVGAPLARNLSNLVSPQGVGRMNADPDGVPGLNAFRIHLARVSSTSMGIAKAFRGVAAASTYCQRGVMTAVPNETLLGLIRCTRTQGLLVDHFFAHELFGSDRVPGSWALIPSRDISL